MPTVYIVDDDKHVRDSLTALVKTIAGLRSDAHATAEDFLASRRPLQPGCLIVDVRMRGLSGLELQEELKNRGDLLPVIVISGYSETPLTVRAMKRGAVTFLDKPCRSSEIVDAILQAIAQDRSVREELERERTIRKTFLRLDRREVEIMKLMLAGEKNKVIAEKMKISIRTVENRRRNIFTKTNTNSIAQLAQLHQEAVGKGGESLQ